MTTQQSTRDSQDKAYYAMQEKVKEACKGTVRVRYSAYKHYGNGVPIDNLGKVVLMGRVAVLDDKHYHEAMAMKDGSARLQTTKSTIQFATRLKRNERIRISM